MGSAAGGLLAAEVCAPLLLLCWLCCWPDGASDSSSDGKHPQRPVLAHVHESGSRRRSSDVFGRRIGSSAISLHLPSTSGYKNPLSAHRSHEEIGRRRFPQEPPEPEARYHSAPSVIDEVLHRRDWERSTKDLHIPLKPDTGSDGESDSSTSPEAPHAQPESSTEDVRLTCKKHHTNIKSSRKKEKLSTDIKDADATEIVDTIETNFYIGEENVINNDKVGKPRELESSLAKEAKQTFNESIRNRERPKHMLGAVDEMHPSLGFCLDDVIDQLDRLEQLEYVDSLDRSGAVHHLESRVNSRVFPPSSTEPVGYEGGACYLAEVGHVALLRGGGAGGAGGRHASDGDILAHAHRPESGAFSESDLDLELEGSEERPPAYEEIHHYTPDRKETAI